MSMPKNCTYIDSLYLCIFFGTNLQSFDTCVKLRLSDFSYKHRARHRYAFIRIDDCDLRLNDM